VLTGSLGFQERFPGVLSIPLQLTKSPIFYNSYKSETNISPEVSFTILSSRNVLKMRDVSTADARVGTVV
jgi:hypothetical protein